VAAALILAVACRRPPPSEPPPIPAPPLPQVAGSIAVDGLSARVTVVRDRSGIPHITASNQDDLFFAQGFVQAQDRLFQMDLWRRSVQGRLSEVLGANFIERDAMTRRIQYRGGLDEEWAAYGADTRAIATAFTRGINAWIAIARDRLPEEFSLAGWRPEEWASEDLLNRTEAFVASTGAFESLLCARLIQESRGDPGGPASDLCPMTARPTVDLSVINATVPSMFRRVGTRPFFTGLNAAVPGRLQQESPTTVPTFDLAPSIAAGFSFAVRGPRTASGGPVLAGSWPGDLESPAARYLVHLRAPGWNVIGATAPWRPGVVMGHNERIAWSFVPTRRATQEVFVERLNPDNPHQVATPAGWRNMTVVREPVVVKGRQEPFESEQMFGPHGPIIAIDRERLLAYAVRWSGLLPGGTAELVALAVGRAQSAPDFQRALQRWIAPAAVFAFADADNHVAIEFAGRVPVNSTLLPSAGWLDASSSRYSATGNRVSDPSSEFVIAAPRSALEARLRSLLSAAGTTTIDDLRAVQHDVVPFHAEQLFAALERVEAVSSEVEAARAKLFAWDRKVTSDSDAALLYVAWEDRVLRGLAASRISPMLGGDFVSWATDLLAEGVTSTPSALLRDTLAAAADDVRRRTEGQATTTWGRFQTLTFRHPLAITSSAARRYNPGPFTVPGYPSTVFSTWRSTGDRSSGPMLQLIMTAGDWDRSRGIIAPGQSAAPDTSHFADLAPVWARGADVALPFSDGAVAEAAESTLVLEPR